MTHSHSQAVATIFLNNCRHNNAILVIKQNNKFYNVIAQMVLHNSIQNIAIWQYFLRVISYHSQFFL